MATPVSPTGGRKKTPLRASQGPKTGYFGAGRGVHGLCGRCKNTCKQSAKARIIICPQFEAKEEKDEKDGDKEKD